MRAFGNRLFCLAFDLAWLSTMALTLRPAHQSLALAKADKSTFQPDCLTSHLRKPCFLRTVVIFRFRDPDL